MFCLKNKSDGCKYYKHPSICEYHSENPKHCEYATLYQNKSYTIDDLEAIILDIIKPDWSFEDIMYFCDLSLKRTAEIYNLYPKIKENHEAGN